MVDASMSGITALGQGPMSANTFSGLGPDTKVQYPTPSARRKRFAKIREKIQGKR
jgi:hypothetical protein